MQLDESLVECAALARRTAPELCRREPAAGESCAWLHGYWPYLRLLGLASTPDNHAGFFLGAIRSTMSRTRAPRVLVSGAADYSMLALVIQAYRQQNVRPDITVVDQCETPLALNRWHAQKAGLEITTRRCDMFEYAEPLPFDAVCTHSFLSEFPPERRSELLGKWRHLLNPGGAVITVNRLRPAGGSAPVGFTPEQARAFRAAVLQQAQSLGATLQADPLELARGAEAYMSRRSSYAVRSRDEIVALFESAGFRMDELSSGPVVAAARQDVSGPTTPGGAEYARIVASRR